MNLLKILLIMNLYVSCNFIKNSNQKKYVLFDNSKFAITGCSNGVSIDSVKIKTVGEREGITLLEVKVNHNNRSLLNIRFIDQINDSIKLKLVGVDYFIYIHGHDPNNKYLYFNHITNFPVNSIDTIYYTP